VKQQRKKRAEKKAKPFTLSPRLQAILPFWRQLDSLPPKLAAVVDTCSLSEVYNRLERGEYDAVKDGHALKISTASIIKRRESLPRAEFRAA
jgi:hypothetical protein